jgi:hypothetical protein
VHQSIREGLIENVLTHRTSVPGDADHLPSGATASGALFSQSYQLLSVCVTAMGVTALPISRSRAASARRRLESVRMSSHDARACSSEILVEHARSHASNTVTPNVPPPPQGAWVLHRAPPAVREEPTQLASTSETVCIECGDSWSDNSTSNGSNGRRRSGRRIFSNFQTAASPAAGWSNDRCTTPGLRTSADQEGRGGE